MAAGSLIVIVGETGSGKSALALELARKFDGEIVSADAWTVYRGFDVGTAKPSLKDRGEVSHHLIDIADPEQGFSAAVFKRQATAAITYIINKGKLPILVGGTGLYIDSVIYNYGFLPAGSTVEREQLDQLSIDELITIIKDRKIDVAGIDLRNKRRLVRLIQSGGVRPEKAGLRPNTLIIGIQTDKDQLEARITTRVDQMLAGGLEGETKQLAEKYGWQTEPMKGIGYREWQLYFEGNQNIEQTRQRIITSSMQLAKKQRTWFKRNKSIHWINDLTQAMPLVKEFLNK